MNSRTNGGQWLVGVPPGVGDTYWCLTKLKALRAQRGVEHVTLAIQKSPYDRALAWAEMVDFVDDARFVEFEPGKAARTGYYEPPGALDCILWPNAVVDRGEHLNAWLPECALDLNFPIRTPDMPGQRVILYPSSLTINQAWMRRSSKFWPDIIDRLTAQYGRVTVVGSDWDKSFRDRLRTLDAEDLIGQTTLPELAAMLRTARVVVGVICGVTIVANHFRTPCVAVYPDHRFPASFPHAWVAPNAPYRALPASSTSVESVLQAVTEIVR